MNQSNMGFEIALPEYRTCKTTSKEYCACGRRLLNTKANFSNPDSRDNPRCRECCRIWETIYDHALKTIEHHIKIRGEDIEINKDIRGRSWRYLTRHFKPLYLEAIKADADMDEMVKGWDKKCHGLIDKFIDEISKEGVLFENLDRKGKPKKIPTNLLYLGVWIDPDGKVHEDGGCPFGVTGRPKKRRGEVTATKLATHDVQIHFTWKVGRKLVYRIETAVKQWNWDENGIRSEYLLMDIESAKTKIEESISQFMKPVTCNTW